jgi:hypothetical protein
MLPLRAALRAAVLAALLISAARACATDLDCHLNGVCAGGVCACDAAWLGATCTTLNLLPSAPGDGTCDAARNGTARGYTTTWGGVPWRGSDGAWHLAASEMARHCGMCSWGSQSQIARWSAPSLAGPYARDGTAVGPFAHNAAAIAVPRDGGAYGGGFLLFHIGIGCDSVGVHACNYSRLPLCANGTTPSTHTPSGGDEPTPPGLARAQLHVAADAGGPWLPAPAAWKTAYCSNNPAPLFLRNGSLMLVCHEPMAPGEVCAHSGGLSMATSDGADWRTGNFTKQCLNLMNPTHTVGNVTFTAANEDPHLYEDARGNLHIITHNQSPCYQNVSWFGADVRGCGAHFFSNDGGASWSFQWDHAVYNGTVLYTDGVRRTYKRERPKLVQDADGSLIALATGIGVEIQDAFSAGNDSACTLVALIARGAA